MRTKTFFAFALIALFIPGCTQDGVRVVTASGTLTLQDEPLPDVRIEFMKTDTGALSYAETDAQGRFVLRHTHGKAGAEPGTYHVSVFRKGKPVEPPPGQPVPEEQATLPEEPVLMSDKSAIEVVVSEQGPNEFVINIK